MKHLIHVVAEAEWDLYIEADSEQDAVQIAKMTALDQSAVRGGSILVVSAAELDRDDAKQKALRAARSVVPSTK